MKPVAWISESEFSHADTGGEHMLVKVRQAENYIIPLYTAPRELSDVFILEHHMGYVSPDGGFYAPDYKTWKENGFTPVYKEPVLPRELSDEDVVIPRELAENYLKITEVPRYKRILEDALKKASEK